MRPSLDPRGILLAHTLPALLLFGLMWQLSTYIRPALDPEALSLWKVHAWALVIATSAATAYAILRIVQRRPVHPLYGVLVFLVYVPLLWSSMDRINILFPSSVPFWMVPEEARLYGIRILSVTLLHGLIVLVGASLPSGDKGHPLRDLLIAAAVPLTCYLFLQLGRPFRDGLDLERHLWPVVMSILVVTFLFFVFRALFSMARRRGGSDTWALVTRILVGLVLPLTGLLVHNGHFLDIGGPGMGPFGDLSHWGFYLIAALNGLVVIMPPSTTPRVRLVQFILRSIGFSYVLYFLVLFLPFLPLSITAILAFGLGFLLLAPVLLFLLQGRQLWDDLRFLRPHHGLPLPTITLLAALMVLPAIITGRYLQHRGTLHRALAIVYHPSPSDDPATVDAAALEQVLLATVDNKQRRGWARAHTPFLTPWYNRIVFDNLTLSDTKIDHLRRIFIGRSTDEDAPAIPAARTSEVALDAATARSTFDPAQQAWRSWVDLRMTNHGAGPAEYSTRFHLPPGAYISDEYLVIEGEPVHGILAERKAATWIYQQIRDFRRDPSLTTYAGPDAISLKVFPLQAGETRTAGFEVLHREPLLLHIDTHRVAIGDATVASPPTNAITSGRMLHVPAAVKSGLPQVQRPTRLHVIADASVSKDERPLILDRISRMLIAEHIPPSSVTLHITDVATRSMAWDEAAKAAYLEHTAKGGFFTDRPIRALLSAQCTTPGTERSVILVAAGFGAPDDKTGVLLEGLDELATCQPDADHYFLLDTDGALRPHPFAASVADTTSLLAMGPSVHAWPDAAHPQALFAVDGGPGTALLAHAPDTGPGTLRSGDWKDALALEGRWRDLRLNPTKGTAGWLSVVQGSFQAQVLSPHTAWICLESDIQRNALLKKQEETLNADAALDAGEEELEPMSEPDLWWALLLPILWCAFRRRPAA